MHDDVPGRLRRITSGPGAQLDQLGRHHGFDGLDRWFAVRAVLWGLDRAAQARFDQGHIMKLAMIWLKDVITALASDTFTICLLAAVLATVVLAFSFGAEADLIVMILILGIATALAETTMRYRNDKGNPK